METGKFDGNRFNTKDIIEMQNSAEARFNTTLEALKKIPKDEALTRIKNLQEKIVAEVKPEEPYELTKMKLERLQKLEEELSR